MAMRLVRRHIAGAKVSHTPTESVQQETRDRELGQNTRALRVDKLEQRVVVKRAQRDLRPNLMREPPACWLTQVSHRHILPHIYTYTHTRRTGTGNMHNVMP